MSTQVMSTLDIPATMNFKVPAEMESATTKSDVLPDKYSKYRIPGTKVHYEEGPFGAFFKQEVIGKDWIIGWLNFDIKKYVELDPLTLDPLLALYIGQEGNIPCDLQGQAEQLTLPEKRMGFYYVPPGGFNRAFFEPFHYTSLYISFSHTFIKHFRDKNVDFQPLLDVAIHQYQEYEKATNAPSSRDERERYLEFGTLIDKQENQEAAGKQGILLPLGNDHIEIIKQMAGYEQKPAWMTSYLYGQIWLMIVSYFNQMTERAKMPADLLKAVDYIETNYATVNKLTGQPISPTDVVSFVKADARELNRLFNEEFKKNMREFMTDFRYSQAKFRLRRTDDKLSVIAEETGLSGASHLTKLIRNEHDMTPGEYRVKFRGY